MNVSCHVRTEIVQSVADCTHLRRQMVLSRETAESSLWESKHKGQLGLHKQDGDLAVTERSPSIYNYGVAQQDLTVIFLFGQQNKTGEE